MSGDFVAGFMVAFLGIGAWLIILKESYFDE